MKIYDCFTYFNEDQLLKLRLETLWDVVDYFVICESVLTHTGQHKTINFDINRYFTNKKDMMLCSSKEEMSESINKILKNKNLMLDLGSAARETAKKHFHIKDYLDKWNDVLDNL